MFKLTKEDKILIINMIKDLAPINGMYNALSKVEKHLKEKYNKKFFSDNWEVEKNGEKNNWISMPSIEVNKYKYKWETVFTLSCDTFTKEEWENIHF